MQFSNLLLKSWNYEKGDTEIPIADLEISKRIQQKNPVPSTYVYSDEASWVQRLKKQVNITAEKAGLQGDDIQGFFGVHNGFQQHIEGASPVVMDAFENPTGFGFDITLGCASVILSAQLAGLHMSNTEVQNVMVGTVQMTTQYTKNCTDGNCIFADSIGAMMFSKGTNGNRVKFTEITTNPYFRDMFVMNEHRMYQIQNIQKGKDLSQFMIESFGNHLRKSSVTLKTFPKDIDFIAMSCSTHAATKMVLESLNIPTERTGLECLTHVPHMGTNDLMYQLDYGIEQGLIKPGSKVLVSGTSIGFSLATMAIEWGVV